MDFPKYNFEDFNETDVREEIVAPLLHEIGYRKGTENDIIREQSLKYQKLYLGRKNKNDPVLRGKADYICETKNKTRWVIEAKAPSESIDALDTVDQAWSYANHPEVRAVFLCICNGVSFSIFQTSQGPEAPAVFSCRYEEMESKLDVIKNILGPDAILRDYPTYKPDYGKPLAPNFRSFASLKSGRIVFQSNSAGLKPFEGLVVAIVDGSVERSEAGKIGAFIKTQSMNQKIQQVNEQLGLHEFNLETDDNAISTDPNAPTVFIGKNETLLPRGIKILNLTTWKEEALPIDISVVTETIATGYLDKDVFSGSFVGKLFYKEYSMLIQLDGEFETRVV